MVNILLIDKRVHNYDYICNSINNDIARYVLFDFYQDTIDDIKERINVVLNANEVGDSRKTVTSVGILQHNYNLPDYQLTAQMYKPCIVVGVNTLDPQLDSWSEFSSFISWCNAVLGAVHFDMLACALYSDNNWKYVIDTLETQLPGGMIIRASTDLTGSATMGGNWFLETHTGVNLKTVYFTDAIDEYSYVLLNTTTNKGVILSNGQVKMWGYSSVYAFGSNGPNTYYTPFTPTQLTNIVATKIVMGSINPNGNTFVLDNSKNLYASGDNANGQFGTGNTNNLTSIQIIQNNVDNVFAGVYTTYIIKNNSLYASGMNSKMFGNGTTTNSASFVQITNITNVGNIAQIEASDSLAFLLYKDGTVYSTGYQSYGQLGLGHFNSVSTFTQVPITNVVQVAIGTYKTLFLKTNGDIYGCGRNDAYSLNPTNVNFYSYTSPIFCFNISNVKYITCNTHLNIVLKNDGTIQ